jgi:DNA polymerase III subunit alpha
MLSPISDFASLHNHSHFSIMDGISLPEEIIAAAKAKGLRSIAITDHGHASAHADIFLHGKKQGVRTILGVEAYLIDDLDAWRAEKERAELDKKSKRTEDEDEELAEDQVGKLASKRLRKKGHLVLLACDRDGLANLYRLIYLSHRDGFYGKPRMDKKMLAAHSKGLVATSACMGGVVSNKCWEFSRGECQWDEVVREAREYDAILGHGRFFLELQFNEHEGQRAINSCMAKISEETGIPLTATTDSHYVDRDDWETQELLYMLRGNKTMGTRGDDWDFSIKQLYIKSPAEMWESFEKFGGDIGPAIAIEAFRNTLLIDSLVEDFEPDTHQRLPKLPFDNPFAEMGKRAIEGLKSLDLAERDEYKDRLMRELSLIKEKGIANYFLVVRQIVAEAKKSQLVGAGRGSAAGSLVCYCLGITDLDPIKHKLLFERFLDPARVELPDIDLDFEDADAAKDMLRRMFGEDNVACLSTYGTFQVKGLMKDMARLFDLDHTEINKINKKIESELRVLYVNQDKSTIVIRLEDIERVSPSFNRFVEQHPEVGRHFKKLYGRNRHIGRHACGVIIGDDLPSETALFVAKGHGEEDDGRRIVQASFTEGIVNKNVSAMGFTKWDILSIATLKVIDHALHLIAERTGKPYEELKESIRPHNLDLDDMVALKNVFWDGNFAGVFQMTGKGIRRLAQRIRPDSFEDVSAIVSLYRPGPLGSRMDKLYADNKRDKNAIAYDHQVLEEILGPTYGCLVYQEQLMQVCQKLGKMELKDVQRVRKSLLKKDKSKTDEFLKKENEELKSKFIAGCKENGLEEPKAEEWWKNLLFFGGYGFNCLCHKLTRVPTYHQDGSFAETKSIEDISVGDLVLTRDEEMHEDVLTDVVDVYDNGEREMFEVVLDDGSKVTCTMDHKFRTTTGEMLPLREIIERDVEIVAFFAEESIEV